MAELLALGSHRNRVGRAEELGEVLLRVPPGQEHVRNLERGDDLRRVPSLPFAGMASNEDQRDWLLQPALCARERSDQQVEPLDGRKAADVEQDCGTR